VVGGRPEARWPALLWGNQGRYWIYPKLALSSVPVDLVPGPLLLGEDAGLISALAEAVVEPDRWSTPDAEALPLDSPDPGVQDRGGPPEFTRMCTAPLEALDDDDSSPVYTVLSRKQDGKSAMARHTSRAGPCSN
jgi:hypothetical protein